MKHAIIIAMLVLLSAGNVSAQSAGQQQNPVAVQAAQDARLRATLSPGAYASYSAVVKAAAAAGLPTAPLSAKAVEGAAKGVPGDRIVLAVAQMKDRMTRAQALLATGRPATSAEIIAVSDALQRDVPESAIRALNANAAGRASIVMSAYAMADLVGQGVPVAVGVEVIGAWREHGSDPVRLKEIPATIERLVRQGVSPARAGAGVAAGLRGGTPLSTITRGNLPHGRM
jgi:hypothetical protein